MDILVLGGTLFLGRHITAIALKGGHRVTHFNRGLRNPQLFPKAERLRGDRDGGLQELAAAVNAGRKWDVVIDTCGYVPRIVSDSARLLRNAAGRYIFISSISVYATFATPGTDESAAVGRMPDPSTETVDGETYGPLKALCEEVVEAEFTGRAVHVRAGLIVGPFDVSDRFTWWVDRVARGGETLAPGSPHAAVQFVDVRDLAAWVLLTAEKGAAGTFNATGPERTLTLGEILQTMREVSGSDAQFTWAGEPFLLERNVTPWAEMPLWVPAETDESYRGFNYTDCSRAVRSGLLFRPLEDTVRDTLAWHRARGPVEWRSGMKPERESDLLAAWHARGVVA